MGPALSCTVNWSAHGKSNGLAWHTLASKGSRVGWWQPLCEFWTKKLSICMCVCVYVYEYVYVCVLSMCIMFRLRSAWLSRASIPLSTTYSPPHTPNKLVGVMLGCCMARRAVQWSLLTKKLSMPLEPKLAPCGWRCPHRRPTLTGSFGNWYSVIEV